MRLLVKGIKVVTWIQCHTCTGKAWKTVLEWIKALCYFSSCDSTSLISTYPSQYTAKHLGPDSSRSKYSAVLCICLGVHQRNGQSEGMYEKVFPHAICSCLACLSNSFEGRELWGLPLELGSGRSLARKGDVLTCYQVTINMYIHTCNKHTPDQG